MEGEYDASFHFTVTDLAIRMVAQTSTDGGSNWIDVINMKSGTAADDNFERWRRNF